MIWAGSSNQAGTSTTPQVDMRFVLVAAQKRSVICATELPGKRSQSRNIVASRIT
jgi:hypothetical protein